jgi:hypothetical protein
VASVGAPAKTPDQRLRGTSPLPPVAAGDLPAALRGRLGLDVPREHWPTVPRLKALEAARFAWLQVHCPPTAMLADPDAAAYPGAAKPSHDPDEILRLVDVVGEPNVIPWREIAPALVGADAPLLLELHPPHRPEPQSLATVTVELLTRTA